jgi:transposase-like protein
MKNTRRRYDREFKISVVAELEGGKPPAQIARERGSHPPHVISYSESISIDIVLAGIA